MWIFSSSEQTWVNIDLSLRLFKDGQNGWAFKQPDGVAVHITDEEYEKVMRFVDPDYWNKHPDAERHPDFDIKKAIDGINKRLDGFKKKD